MTGSLLTRTIVQHVFFYGVVSPLRPIWSFLAIIYANISQLVPVTPTALVQRAGVPPEDCTFELWLRYASSSRGDLGKVLIEAAP